MMIEKISSKDTRMNFGRICNECGQKIEKDDIWYPFFDISTHGGGILYLHARCAVDRVVRFVEEDKEGLLERVKEAGKEKGDPLSDGLMNFFWAFPISPIHWIDYAIKDDFEEIKELVKEIEEQEKGDKSGN